MKVHISPYNVEGHPCNTTPNPQFPNSDLPQAYCQKWFELMMYMRNPTKHHDTEFEKLNSSIWEPSTSPVADWTTDSENKDRKRKVKAQYILCDFGSLQNHNSSIWSSISSSPTDCWIHSHDLRMTAIMVIQSPVLALFSLFIPECRNLSENDKSKQFPLWFWEHDISVWNIHNIASVDLLHLIHMFGMTHLQPSSTKAWPHIHWRENVDIH